MNTESKDYIVSIVSRFFEKHNVSRVEFSKAISIITDTLNEIGYDPRSLTPHPDDERNEKLFSLITDIQSFCEIAESGMGFIIDPDKADDTIGEVKATLAEW